MFRHRRFQRFDFANEATGRSAGRSTPPPATLQGEVTKKPSVTAVLKIAVSNRYALAAVEGCSRAKVACQLESSMVRGRSGSRCQVRERMALKKVGVQFLCSIRKIISLFKPFFGVHAKCHLAGTRIDPYTSSQIRFDCRQARECVGFGGVRPS